jgi:glycerophosphoryl diester phosphodiesterase
MTWVLGAAVSGLGASKPVEWIAHRGESADAPENTLAAFKLAWDRNVLAIELDVHLASDGSLVVIHDADAERTTGVSRLIKDSTSDELTSLDAGTWKAPRYSAEHLPLLGEVLATIPGAGRCFIEVKVGPEAIPWLVDVVRASGKKPEQIVIIAFDPETVAEAKRKLPELKAYFLAHPKRDEAGEWKPGVATLIAKAKELGADGLGLCAPAVDAEWVKQIKGAGLGLHVWTVDNPAEARRLIDAGVDGITSNKPSWLRDQF